MGSLLVRNVDDDLVSRLKARAAAHGRSAEAEHRDILRQALARVVRRAVRRLARSDTHGARLRRNPERDHRHHGKRQPVKLLLDTHVLLWLLNDDHLNAEAREALTDPASGLFVSVVSLWEIVIKRRIGKLTANIAAITAHMAPASKLQWLGITPDHLLALDRLVVWEHHKDPFDHLIIAQAISEGITLMTRDRNAVHYPLRILSA